MIPQEKLDAIVDRFEKIEAQMSSGDSSEDIIRLSKEHGELKDVVEKARELISARTQLVELAELAKGDDAEMAELAGEELKELEEGMPDREHELELMLIPKDKADDSSVILEVRAGTGGDEAAIFAGDLFRMYQRYASIHGWRVEVMSASDAEMGGYKEIQASVSGDGVFARLKFEVGRASRSARAGDTETQGRVHTSAATVAVLARARRGRH